MPERAVEPLFPTSEATAAANAIGALVGALRVRWYDEPVEGWDAMIEPADGCICDGPKGCYCCDPASVTREQVEALRRMGFEFEDGGDTTGYSSMPESVVGRVTELLANAVRVPLVRVLTRAEAERLARALQDAGLLADA